MNNGHLCRPGSSSTLHLPSAIRRSPSFSAIYTSTNASQPSLLNCLLSSSRPGPLRAQRIGRAGLRNHARACDTCSGVPGDQVFGERIAARLLALSRRSRSSSTPLCAPDLRQQSAARSSCIGCTHSCIGCAFVRGTALRTSSCTEFVRLLQATYHGNWCEWSRRCLRHWFLRRVHSDSISIYRFSCNVNW